MEYPQITNQVTKEGGVELTLEISPALEAFRGHFDSAPIIPGVEQLKWVVYYANQFLDLDRPVQVERVDALKFQNVIQPDSKILLNLTKGEQKIQFAFTSEGKRHSSGKIVIE